MPKQYKMMSESTETIVKWLREQGGLYVDALAETRERLADVEGALYLAFVEQGCRPDEAKDYMLMAVGSQEGRDALQTAGISAPQSKSQERRLAHQQPEQWGEKTPSEHWCTTHNWYVDRPCIHCPQSVPDKEPK